MMIKAVIFDYGEVLNVMLDRTEEKAHRARIAKQLGLSPEEVWSYLFDGEASRGWMTGQLTWDEFWTQVLAPRGITDPAEVEAFSSTIFNGTKHVNPEMIEILFALRGRYKLAVLSNTTWSEDKMRKRLYNDYELPDDLFDVVVTSRSVGFVKPEFDIFEIAIKRLGVKPEEIIFADDLPKFTAAAAQLGINTHTFTTPAKFRAYLEQMGVL